MAVRFDLEHEMGEPEGLHGLPEALRRPVGHLVEDPAHLQELRPAGFVRLLLRRLEGEVGVPPGEGAHRVHHDDDRAVEITLVDIAVVGQVERGELFLRAALIVPEARPQHVAVIDRAVRVARGDVALRLDDAEVIVEPRVGREGREAPVEHRVVLPEGRDLPQLPLILLRDVKDVAVPRSNSSSSSITHDIAYSGKIGALRLLDAWFPAISVCGSMKIDMPASTSRSMIARLRASGWSCRSR